MGSGVGIISSPPPPRIFELLASPSTAVGELNTTQRPKVAALPENDASEPEAEVIVRFGAYPLLNNPTLPLCWKETRFTVPVKEPVVPPVPVRVKVNGALDTS